MAELKVAKEKLQRRLDSANAKVNQLELLVGDKRPGQLFFKREGLCLIIVPAEDYAQKRRKGPTNLASGSGIVYVL